MSHAKLRKIRSYLPAWGALLLGFGALIGGARADRAGSGEIMVRIDGENIYISQDGSTFEQLRLGDTPETAHLKQLLRDEGADRRSVSVPVGSMIVASGGGSGRGDKPRQQSSRATGDTGNGK
jgi:hypothetical protein